MSPDWNKTPSTGKWHCIMRSLLYMPTKFGELWSTNGENGTGVSILPKSTFSDVHISGAMLIHIPHWAWVTSLSHWILPILHFPFLPQRWMHAPNLWPSKEKLWELRLSWLSTSMLAMIKFVACSPPGKTIFNTIFCRNFSAFRLRLMCCIVRWSFSVRMWYASIRRRVRPCVTILVHAHCCSYAFWWGCSAVCWVLTGKTECACNGNGKQSLL